MNEVKKNDLIRVKRLCDIFRSIDHLSFINDDAAFEISYRNIYPKELDLQSFTKYLRLTPVFMGNSALQKRFNFCFPGDFCRDWVLGYHSIKF